VDEWREHYDNRNAHKRDTALFLTPVAMATYLALQSQSSHSVNLNKQKQNTTKKIPIRFKWMIHTGKINFNKLDWFKLYKKNCPKWGSNSRPHGTRTPWRRISRFNFNRFPLNKAQKKIPIVFIWIIDAEKINFIKLN